MRIAFDVAGTLVGRDSVKVVGLFKALHDLGHDMVIWSNSLGYAFDAHNDLTALGLKSEFMLKYSTYDAKRDELQLMDLCFEDDKRQDWLGSKRIIFVHEIPDDVETYAKELSK